MARHDGRVAGPKEVSAREAEVLAALAGGRSNAQIARQLHISVRTVESHVSALLRKYGVSDRHELAGLAGPTSRLHHTDRSRHELRRPRAGAGRTPRRPRKQPAGEPPRPRRRRQDPVGPTRRGRGRRQLSVRRCGRRPGPGAARVRRRRGGRSTPGREQPPQTSSTQCWSDSSVAGLCSCSTTASTWWRTWASLVARILAEAPETAVLATSRERIGVAGERPVQLGPLELGSEAEQLFRDRAALVAPELADDADLAAKVCAGLDGVPLAIELAAAGPARWGRTGCWPRSTTGCGSWPADAGRTSGTTRWRR